MPERHLILKLVLQSTFHGFVSVSCPQVQTEIALLTQKEKNLLSVISLEEQCRRQKREELLKEKEALIKFKECLERQKKLSLNANQQGNDGWVIVPRNGDEI